LRANRPAAAVALGLALAAAVAPGAAGCASTRYASPSAAHPAAGADKNQAAVTSLTLDVFRNRAVAVRVLDNRMERPQSAVLVDEVRAVVDGALEQAHVGAGTDPAAMLEVRIVRYGAQNELSTWRACVGFGASVEVPPARRHEVATERCATTDNVWGTKSGDEALRVAFREASRDLLSQLDGLPASAPAQPPAAGPTPAP
jgi:hypothetical protein